MLNLTQNKESNATTTTTMHSENKEIIYTFFKLFGCLCVWKNGTHPFWSEKDFPQHKITTKTITLTINVEYIHFPSIYSFDHFYNFLSISFNSRLLFIMSAVITKSIWYNLLCMLCTILMRKKRLKIKRNKETTISPAGNLNSKSINYFKLMTISC